MQGVWHALNRQDWSSDVAPLAAALAEKACPNLLSAHHCLVCSGSVQGCGIFMLQGSHKAVGLVNDQQF